MQHTHRIHPPWRHAAVPTYLGSYVFPVLFVVYEVYRVGYWIAQHGVEFAAFGEADHGSTLMLALFAVQLVAEGVFLATAWLARQPNLDRRFTNLTLGLVCSLLVLAFDYGLQIAF